MSELLDIYDENRVRIGVKARDAVHRDGDWHRTFHCWIIYRDTDGVDYMVMQWRGPDKDIYPDLIDISAAGHYAAGEGMADGVREIREELGLDVVFEDLIPVGCRISVCKDDGLVDYEFNDVFFLICDKPLREYDFQREEVSGLVRFQIDNALALFAGMYETIPADAVGAKSGQITLCQEDFVPNVDNYTYRALVLAKRCLNGEKHLVI